MKFTIRDLFWLTVVVALGVNRAFGEPPKLKVVSAEQKSMAVESVKKRGWDSYEEADPIENERIPFFTMPTPATDPELQRFPDLPFSFGLNLSGSKITDDGIKRLAKLHTLRVLHLDAIRSVSDRGLEALAPAKNLVELHVSSPLITDDGIGHVAKLENLSRLFLSQTKLGDTGMREVAKLPHLQFLDISGTQISNIGLGELARFQALEHLSVAGTEISDAGIERLVIQKKLKSLDLSLTKVSDRGLRHLAKLENLGELMLAGTVVSDTGLTALLKLKSLRTLNLTESKVTEDGVRKLKQALPRCDVSH